MLILLVAHVLMAFAAPWLVSVFKRRAFIVMAAAPAAAAIYALFCTRRVLAGDYPVEVVQWVPGLQLDLTLRMDTLSWLMLLIVGGVGALVLIYCSAYFAPTATGLRRFGAELVAFAGSMVGLVVSDNMLLLFVFWELTIIFADRSLCAPESQSACGNAVHHHHHCRWPRHVGWSGADRTEFRHLPAVRGHSATAIRNRHHRRHCVPPVRGRQ